jgi:ABC-type lipoprotein export system ATPase subunit
METKNAAFQKFINEFLKIELPIQFDFDVENNSLVADLEDFEIKISYEIMHNFNCIIYSKSEYQINNVNIFLRNKLQPRTYSIDKHEIRINYILFGNTIDISESLLLFKVIYSLIQYIRSQNNRVIEDFKLKKIELSNFNQFENLILNLTYPKGHEKEGEALKKVCFIGQNGTGKTSILKIIQAFIKQDSEYFNEKNKIKINYQKANDVDINLNILDKNFTIDFIEDSHNILKNIIKKYIYFPANIIDKAQNEPNKIKKNEIIDFNIHSAMQTWEFVKEEINKYKQKEKKEREKLSDIVYTETPEKIKKAAADFEKWKEKNLINPLEELADKCLDRFLKRFNLKVKTKLDFRNESDINNIKIENLQGEELGNLENTLSTGTKQILYTAMPLYTLKPESTTVLFDEPERSLYPDIQKEIVEFYTSLSPESQFFFATHSPIIASSFEPWEIVELEFDENGKVRQKLWYEGERQVDNYKVDARYLSWDDIFMKLFGLKQDGADLRLEKLMEVASLRKKLEKQKFSDQEREVKYKEYKHLAQLVNYNFGQ